MATNEMASAIITPATRTSKRKRAQISYAEDEHDASADIEEPDQELASVQPIENEDEDADDLNFGSRRVSHFPLHRDHR
jgi:hypothetical protein